MDICLEFSVGENRLGALAAQDIVFYDNHQRPFYRAGHFGEHEASMAPIILIDMIQAFFELRPDSRAIPMPTHGSYASMPLDDIFATIGEEDLLVFLDYVARHPAGYTGKQLRITEAFAGWVMNGAPEA